MKSPATASAAERGAPDGPALPVRSAPASRRAATRRRHGATRHDRLANVLWGVASLAVFGGLWEAAWGVGLLDPLLVPPPHIFLRHFTAQAQFFGGAEIGVDTTGGAVAVLSTVLATSLRVLSGLTLGFVASLTVGVLVTQVRVFGRLVLPTLTLLAPISPVAWLPVSIFLLGIGNGPAVFLVFIGVFFIMTLATVSQINSVSPTYLNVARTMGATRRQTLFRVILPSILPGLFVVLRLNLFAAWIVVLLAEAIGVGNGLGQVVVLARNTFNSSLVFFTMFIIGISGYTFDLALRTVQRRLLWWQAPGSGSLG